MRLSGYSAGCLEHLHALYESLIHWKGLGIWRKANLGRKQLFGAAFTQATQQPKLVMLGLPRSYLFLHYHHQISNFRKACESSDVTALNSLLEFGAFILIFLSPRQSMSPHSFFIHQLRDDSPCCGGEGTWTLFSQGGTTTRCSPPFLWRLCSFLTRTETYSWIQKGGNPVVMTWCVAITTFITTLIRLNLCKFPKQVSCWL